MTHLYVVERASEYLSKRCNVVLPEFFCFNRELPDVIGFKNTHSTVIEVKVSRSDFLSDKKKSFRIRPEEGMGDNRYYCVPKDLISKHEVPDGWGLLYVYPSGSVRKIKESFYKVTNDSKFRFHKKNKEAEMHVLYYYARRANYAGVHNRIIEYRGYDS